MPSKICVHLLQTDSTTPPAISFLTRAILQSASQSLIFTFCKRSNANKAKCVSTLFWTSITGVSQSITVWNIHHVPTFQPCLNRLLGVQVINMSCKLCITSISIHGNPKHRLAAICTIKRNLTLSTSRLSQVKILKATYAYCI